MGSGGETKYVGEVPCEVYSVSSRTQPHPRVVLCILLPDGRLLWICSCPAKLNPDFNHDCWHIRQATRERKRGWVTAK